MPVQLNQPGHTKPFPLISPLEEVKAKLGLDWVASQKLYGNREIVVTVPFPDTIRLTGDILNEDLLVPDHSGKSAFAVYKELDAGLLGFIASFPANPSAGIKAEKLTKYELNVSLSDIQGRLAWAQLKRRKGKDYGIWSFTLQFSAFKVGRGRLSTMIGRLEDSFCMLDMVKLIARLPVSRCDLAIDLYGLRPFDLVLIRNGGGKVSTWGDEAHLETVYLYEKKPPPTQKPKHGSYKAHGKLLARIYDRSAYAKWHKLPLPAGGISVTRFEITRNWKSKRPLLSELVDVKNMLTGAAAGVAWPPSLCGNQRWERIHRSRFPNKTRWCELGTPVSTGIALNQLYDTFPADLISPAAWARWGDGLALTGLDQLA